MSGPKAQGFSVREFLEALGEQLDRAQDGLAVKVRSGRPLTWALKDLALELKVFVEMNDTGEVRLRTAAANESGASTINLAMTTITRPMVEENTFQIEEETDPRGIEALRSASDLSDDDQRRLGRMGVRTVGQLRRVAAGTDPRQLEAVIGIPALRLRSLLEASSRPSVSDSQVVRSRSGPPLLRVRGANLSDGIDAEVRLAGEPVQVLEAKRHELLVRPLSHHTEGQVEVFVAGERATGFFRMEDPAGSRSPSSATEATPDPSPEFEVYDLAVERDRQHGMPSARSDQVPQPRGGRG